MRSQLSFGAVALLLVATAAGGAEPPANADEARDAEPEPPAPDPTTLRARALFERGVELVKRARWAEALAAFERSASLRPHTTTTYNIGACERALGRYTRARETFARALRQQAKNRELAPSLEEQTRTYLAELDRVLARVTVTLEPLGARLSVDGRPIERHGERWIAGIAPPGPARAVGERRFTVVLNPGAHVFTVSLAGHRDAVVNRTVAPGAREALDLRVQRLPATLNVTANQGEALVSVDGRDVGPVPVEVRRAAGEYRIEVSKRGFEPYETTVRLSAGQRADLRARLLPERTTLTERWWFWAGAAAVVVGGAALTYALTRPDPEPPDFEGGNTGWVAQPGIVF